MKKIISVVGARPNFMKVAPIHRAFQKYQDKIQHLICHTGQHYDERMSKIFFEEFELPSPHFYLGVGSGSHAVQTARIMVDFERVLLEEEPDLIIVVGDVNSTLACSLTASKMHIPAAHVEAGLRSFDRTMPEEINRLLTDTISDYLFVTEKSGIDNLKREGIAASKIHFVGNVMIDTLIQLLPKADKSDIMQRYDVNKGGYVLVTMHRPANVDSDDFLQNLADVFKVIAKKKKIIFPVHPRTRANIERVGLNGRLSGNIMLTDPIGYIDFLNLTKNAGLVITDSGGIQEESTYLGVQCITVRDNTERPVTVEMGTNRLIGTELTKVMSAAMEMLEGKTKNGSIPDLWDGKAAERIAEILTNNLT